MITLYNSCARKFIYLQNLKTFSAPAVVVILERRFGNTYQSISHLVSLQYKRVLEDSDWGRSNSKGPHVSQVKRGVSLYAYICLHHLEVWKNSYFYYQLFRFLMPCICMKTPCIYAMFYLKMWNTFKTNLWGSEQIKMASTKAEKLITLNHN